MIENEFGEIGIDGTFMHDSGIEITEINSGCICCSLVGDFETSLVEVMVQILKLLKLLPLFKKLEQN